MAEGGSEALAYKLNDACRVSGIGRSRLYELISEGEILARKSGKATLIDGESLRAYLRGLPPAVIRVRTRRSSL